MSDFLCFMYKAKSYPIVRLIFNIYKISFTRTNELSKLISNSPKMVIECMLQIYIFVGARVIGQIYFLRFLGNPRHDFFSLVI